ncbi:MAG: VOC family protein [Candidatus Sericytochromatia bacterium]
MIKMIDHIGIGVKDYDKSKAFYIELLKTLGYEFLYEYGKASGFGVAPKAEFWISEENNVAKSHIAFCADSREKVDAFYNKAIELGAKDNGKPGIREIYHPNYYGAFVFDFDGNNIEAVFHG